MTLAMMGKRLLVLPLGVSVILASPAAHAAGDVSMGQTQYEGTCGGCHSLDANRVGPRHRGVVGRRPGSVPGFAYSLAVRKLGGVWTPARLDLWLQDPQVMAPGAKMFVSVPDPVKRANIIAYLSSVSPASAKARRRDAAR